MNLTTEQRQRIEALVDRYSNWISTPMHLNEAKWSHIEMANGRDGSALEMGNIRQEFYPGLPDAFFQAVCNKMNWAWKGERY